MTTSIMLSKLKGLIIPFIILCTGCKNNSRDHNDFECSITVSLSDSARYLNMGNADTALAIFFIQNKYDSTDFNSLFQHFINYVERKDSLDHLIKNLVTNNPDSAFTWQNFCSHYEEYTRYARYKARINFQTYLSLYHDPV